MSAELKYWYLNEHKLFSNLSFSEIDKLCILKRYKKSVKDEIVELPYQEKEAIYFLKQGTLKLVTLNEEGDEVLIEILQKGDLFGELSFSKDDAKMEYLKVVSDQAILCTFFREKLEETMMKKPDFALKYIKFIGFNYKQFKNSYKNILFKDARSRLLLLLESIIEKEGLHEHSFALPNYLTQKDFAQLICATRQTVITLFQELENEGIIKYSKKEIQITDLQKLNNLIKNVK